MSQHDNPKVFLTNLRNAIIEKYGPNAVAFLEHLKITPEQEKEYLLYLKEQYKKSFQHKNLLFTNECRVCEKCEKFSFELKDDLYLNKYGCCFECYIKFIEGRENG